MIYLELFWRFFQVGLLSVGGGYAAMPLIQAQVVEARGWLTLTQFADVMAISEMTPGPITLNAATVVGVRTAGVPGAVVATIGCIAAPCIIMTLLAFLYYRYRGLSVIQGILAGLRPAVIAMIASAAVSLLILAFYGQRTLPEDLTGINWIAVGLFAAALFALRKWKISPLWAIAGTGAAGLILYSIF